MLGRSWAAPGSFWLPWTNPGRYPRPDRSPHNIKIHYLENAFENPRARFCPSRPTPTPPDRGYPTPSEKAGGQHTPPQPGPRDAQLTGANPCSLRPLRVRPGPSRVGRRFRLRRPEGRKSASLDRRRSIGSRSALSTPYSDSAAGERMLRRSPFRRFPWASPQPFSPVGFLRRVLTFLRGAARPFP